MLFTAFALLAALLPAAAKFTPTPHEQPAIPTTASIINGEEVSSEEFNGWEVGGSGQGYRYQVSSG